MLTPLLVLWLGMVTVAFGQESTFPVKVDAPAVFKKPTPRNLEDLRAMQDHMAKLVPHLKECTVNLKIGSAQGSGVIVSADGLVLTAAHVSGAPGKPLTVRTHDGKVLSGVSLGRNGAMDASMVRILGNRTDFPYCEVERQGATELGEWCLTLGHPGGYQEERGLVLRVGRVIFQSPWMIQTDCEMIGGDSGGPLFNMSGEVIGINTRIGEGTQFNFHVPIAAYVGSWDRLKGSEDFQTHSGAYLGLAGVTAANKSGLYIRKVFPGDPADRAGVRVGDILQRFQSSEVYDMKGLAELVGQEQVGKTVTLQLLRDGKPLEIKVRLSMRWD